MTLWYKDSIIYQLHVKCFYDSNSDGIGDFPGLIKKLDYIVSLGITAIWLLPFYPSPLKDDGYDIADYYTIHTNYGHLVDFKRFLKEAHARKLKVITELVINHTSDQHEWFQLSRKAKRGSKWDTYYMWSDTQDKYREARIIFKDFETSNWAWDPVKKMYYWHRFYSHQPDLNFDSPFVKQEIYRILDFWFGLGVDGLRLDAIPYLYAREGTKCENLPETHHYLKELRSYVDRKYEDRMLLAEANQWPEDAICYFGSGDECHMAFHFPVMPRLFMAIQMEDSFPILDTLDQTPPIPENCQWAMFLRNHDELTLEMVTDEERDYMYRMYAKDPKARLNLGIRRRLSPLLQNNRAKYELMHILLFSLPGTPVIYYGDEIGMGDNYYLGDRNGVRTPMQWSSDRNGGFSRANPQQLYLPLIIDPQYHYENINVENQEQNPSSLLWWMRNVITLRHHYRAFGNGTLNFLTLKNTKVLAFLRKFEKETILVVVNLSKHSQYVELDLSPYCGYQPYDMFSQNKFPLIKESEYGISLGPYGYYWLSLEREGEFRALSEERGLPEIVLSGRKDLWDNPRFLQILQEYLPRCRWCKKLMSIKLKEALPIGDSTILFIEDDQGETYLFPICVREMEAAHAILREHPQAAVALIKNKGKESICLDAFFDQPFQRELGKMIDHRKVVRNHYGELTFHKSRVAIPQESKVLKEDVSDSTILYGDQLILKLYRRVEEGINPDLEVVKYLSEKKHFQHVLTYAGAIIFQDRKKNRYDLAKLQKYERHEGDAFTQMVGLAKLFFEGLRSGKKIDPPAQFNFLQDNISGLRDLLGHTAAEMATLIGACTAKMHIALATPENDAPFLPEPFTFFDQRAVYDTMRKQIKHASGKLEKLQISEKELHEIIRVLNKKRFALMNIRIHGNYHLGCLVHRGKDFLIADFEGDPVKTIGERRMKKLVIQDVARMIYSFFEAAFCALKQITLREEEVRAMEPWAEAWAQFMSYNFYTHYVALLSEKNLLLLPSSREDCQVLMQAYLLDKCLSYSSEDLSAFRAVWRVCKPARTPSS